MGAELGDVAIRVLAHGPGIEFTTSRTAASAGVVEVIESGVEVFACRNTLRRKDIPENELLPGVQVIPAGLAALVRWQHEGWAYIHP